MQEPSLNENNFFGTKQNQLFAALAPDAFLKLKLDREVSQKADRDEWGNWDGQFVKDQSSLRTPSIDTTYRHKDGYKWNVKHPFVVAITHDIDTINPFSFNEYFTRFRRTLSPVRKARIMAGFLKNKLKKSNQSWDFKAWIDTEKKYGFRSTWFIFPEKPNPWFEIDCTYSWNQIANWSSDEKIKFIDAIRRLSHDGFEIGLHGSYYSATDAETLRIQKDQLSAALGKKIVSGRQHYLRYDPAKTPSVHEAAGFLNDSTLGMNRNVGFRAGTSFPFFSFNHQASRMSNVLQVPLILQDGALFGDYCLNLNFNDAKKLSLKLLDEVEAVNGVYTLLFHPDCQTDNAKWDLFNVVLEECHRRGAWGATLSEIRSSWL